MKSVIAVFLTLLVTSAFAKKEQLIFDYASNRVERCGWVNLDSAHHLFGPEWTPEMLTNRTVVVHRWCMGCHDITSGIADFNKFAKRHGDIVCLTSYLPSSPDKRSEVENFLKANKVKTSVYTGAAHENAREGKSHRALYIVGPGGIVTYESNQNTGEVMNNLERQYKVAYEQCLLEEIRHTENQRERMKLEQKFRKLYPKSAAKLRNI